MLLSTIIRRTILTAIVFLGILQGTAAFSMTTTTRMTSSTMKMSNNNNNVLVSSAFLIPYNNKMVTAHSTRQRVMDMLRNTKKSKKEEEKSSMIIDITATTWNWDTYAIVAGNPVPIKLKFDKKEELDQHLMFDEKKVVQKSTLVPQLHRDNDDGVSMVWVPKGSILKECSAEEREGELVEYIFEAPIDPNDDRLEHYEQCVVDANMLYKQRAALAHACMRSMVRFYKLDRIVCWDLSWGIWEAEVDDGEEDGYPCMKLLKNDDSVPFPTSLDKDDDVSTFYDCCQPISSELLAKSLKSVLGYYLVGGNTYTMSLFHHMWDQQEKEGKGHMQLLRDLLSKNELFYMGHSAGAIMSGPNILTATFKGIDAFSVVTQPYNSPFMKLPPSESAETFFTEDKNNLVQSRTQMLKLMKKYDAWKGYHVVEAMTFPHYDARPRFASFPQSAETYLRATDDRGNFEQVSASLFVENREEPQDVTTLREETNSKQLPCYPIANGHALLLSYKGLKEALSPEEEFSGLLHWDCYMPYVPDQDYKQFVDGRTSYTMGSITKDKDTMPGDRTLTTYNGARIFSRLNFLGLPNPNRDIDGSHHPLFHSSETNQL
mmetsp:Transcript_44017/g.49952  ORF Transcript_44017/g.49952 Transcript_44017/m.49952 type:complete len:602 (+) Transcript_44017:93-1898(+)